MDLYCGAGGASAGLYQAGFDVTGVDILPQKRYPFTFLQADVADLDPEWVGSFDLIWASPPCQAYSKLQAVHKREYPELIPFTRSLLLGARKPYIIENVPGAPLIIPVMLCGTMFGLRTYRHRLFETSFPVRRPPHPRHTAPTAKQGREVRDGEFITVTGHFIGADLGREAMGIDWMSRDELTQAVPPAYARFLAEQFLQGAGCPR